MSNYTLEQAKEANLKAAKWLRDNTDKDLYLAFNGSHYDAGGVHLTLYLSGSANVLDQQLPSDELRTEREALEAAYQYYRDVRKAAKAIAPTLLPKKVYVREGRSFKVFA